MLSIEEAKDRATDLVARAMKAGASAADAVYIGNGATSVHMRLGQLEDVDSSEGEEIGLRVFCGKQSASTSSSDMSLQTLNGLAERAVAMAEQAPEDQFAGLAPSDLLMQTALPDLDMLDETQVSPTELRARALEAEEAARSIAGVTNSDGGSASVGRAVVAIATSHGFSGGYSGSSHSLSASVVAGEGTGMQRDYGYHSARHLVDLDNAAEIGREAGTKAVARLNPVKLKSGTMPVIFDPRVSSGLIGYLAGAIVGSSIARKSSFLLEKLNSQIFTKGINIIDAPHLRRGLRSKPFDGEGLPTHETHLVRDGVLTGWLMDSASARQLGLAPTGHAVRGVSGPPGAGTSNLYLENGTVSPSDLMSDIKLGLYVTELMGQGVNLLTGDYSRGAAGFVIRDGVIAEPVSEITIASTLLAMFAELTPANDLEFKHASNAPTLRINEMTIAGD